MTVPVDATEPKVSIHGIPQSKYESSGLAPDVGDATPPSGGGGIMDNIRSHWPIWTVGLGIATIVVIIWVSRSQTASSTSGAASATGTGNTAANGSQLWGSQLESDYQQIMYGQNTQAGLLNSILNQPGATYASTGNVRSSTLTGQTASYDIKNPKGIPIRSFMDASAPITGYASYGSALNFSGPAIAGGSNFGQNKGTGSSLWEPLATGGYVSAYDVTGLGNMLPEVKK